MIRKNNQGLMKRRNQHSGKPLANKTPPLRSESQKGKQRHHLRSLPAIKPCSKCCSMNANASSIVSLLSEISATTKRSQTRWRLANSAASNNIAHLDDPRCDLSPCLQSLTVLNDLLEQTASRPLCGDVFLVCILRSPGQFRRSEHRDDPF